MGSSALSAVTDGVLSRKQPGHTLRAGARML